MSYDYDVVVIGGGAAGLTASGMSANFGAKTMLVEAHRLGGDCTWTGCIPSKTLLKASRVVHQMRNAGKYGLIDTKPDINFKKIMEHVWEVRQDVYEEADQPDIYRDMGIDIEKGRAGFVDPHTIEIQGADGEHRLITSRFFIISAGSSAFVPPIKGIQTVDYLTNASLFELDKLPGELLIIGAGPIGTEMAQGFNRFGSKVTVVDMISRILSKDDRELSELLREKLEDEGMTYYLGANVKKVENAESTINLHISYQGQQHILKGDALLMATGRRPNVDELNPEAAGINFSPGGIEVNDRCRTSQKHIFACGDITGRYQFTHMSEHMAKVAVTNALLRIPTKIDTKNVPWCTYTDPEMAHVGRTEDQLMRDNVNYKCYRFPFNKMDRAITENETTGWIKVFARKWSGKILGVSILGVNAGEMIGEFALAMRNGVSLRRMADTIHPYPTYVLGNRRAADQWYVQNQSELLVKALKKAFGYRGEIPDLSDPDRII